MRKTKSKKKTKRKSKPKPKPDEVETKAVTPTNDTDRNNAPTPPPMKQQQQPLSTTTTISQPGSHPFEVDDSDHCETPLKAYQDLTVILDRLLLREIDEPPPDGSLQSSHTTTHTTTNPNLRSSLRIYDPYYCDGGVKTKLASMGFTNVINGNRDFYQDIQTGQIPDYDVLVTNPPYSGHHMERLLEFCASASQANNKPSFLLLPHFVYTKEYYERALSSGFFFFLIPHQRYSYVPPDWVADRNGASKALSKGKETTAPFPSFWYCHHPGRSKFSHEWLEDTFGKSGAIRPSGHLSSGLRYARIPREIPLEFKGEFDPTKKRPNPRARKRMRKGAAAAMGVQGGQSLQQQQKQQQRDPKKKKKRRY